MFELRRLRMLHELALRGTLAAVAEALSYSPSTISQQLSLLEKEAGVALFAADGRRVRLTEQGEVLAAHAAAALELDERARGDLAAGAAGRATVRAAVLQTTAQSVLPTALALLAEREPGLRLEVSEVPPEEGLFELAARRFDLVIAEQYPGHSREHRPGLERVALGGDAIRLAVPPGDPATRLAHLRDRAWVLEPSGTAARQWAVQQCRAAGFEPDVRYEMADLTAHARLISSGHAVGMLPDLLWSDADPSVGLLDLPGRPTRELFAAVRTSAAARSPIHAVVTALREALAARVR